MGLCVGLCVGHTFTLGLLMERLYSACGDTGCVFGGQAVVGEGRLRIEREGSVRKFCQHVHEKVRLPGIRRHMHVQEDPSEAGLKRAAATALQ